MNLWETSFFTTIATVATLASSFVVARFIEIFAAFVIFGQLMSFICLIG